MSTELRKTGIGVVGDIPWGTHFCHFYETKQDLVDTLVPYFKAGLERKEYCLWVVSDSHIITLDEAKTALEQNVPDLDRHLLDQNIEIMNGPDWYIENDVFNSERVISAWDAKLEHALARGYDGMRVSGDTFWLGEKDRKDFCAYEKHLNDSIRDRPMTVLCTYPLGKSGATEVLDVVQTHQFAIARRKGEWQVIETPELIKAKAEIDRLNAILGRISESTPAAPVILTYGVAALSVGTALILALWVRVQLDRESTPIVALFLCAVTVSTWFGGVGPGLFAIALSILSVSYYFVPPVYSFAVMDVKEIPRLIVFVLASLLVGSLSVAQRKSAESLRHARDVLDGTVQTLKQTNVALERENAERKRAEEAVRRSEDRLRLVIDTIPMMAWSFGPDGTVDFLNQRWTDYSGLSLEQFLEEPTGPIHPEDIPRSDKKWQESRTTGEPFEEEIRLRRADGAYRWFLVRTAPLHDELGNIVKWYGVSIDIEDRRRAEDRLRVTTSQLRAISARFQSAKDEEGSRIAREVHDELGSALTSLRWDLESFDKVISASADQVQLDVLRERIDAMLRLTESAVSTVRRIASELRPAVLDDLGLEAAVEWQSEQFQARTGIICKCDFSSESLVLDREKSTAVFRIFQEVLTNILRHSEATAIDIATRAEAGEFVLAISDNGRGITEAEKSASRSLGLLGMYERAHLIGAEVIITGIKGTVVTVRVPILRDERELD